MAGKKTRGRSAEPAVPNPFIIGHHAEGEAFCNRESEVERLAAAFADPSSRVVAYGERRLGKSSILQLAAHQAREQGHAVAVVDLASATSAAAAAQRVLSAVHREIGERWRDLALRLASRLRPGVISISSSTDERGQPTVSFSVTPAALGDSDSRLFTEVLDAIDAELAARRLVLGLGLDEFQRLRHWCGDDVDWLLKEMFERHRRIAYVLAGSERSIVDQMLEHKKAGLWKVVDIVHIGPIEPAVMARWIVDRARVTGVRLDIVTAAAVVRIAGSRTRDIVQLARALWDMTRDAGVATKEHASDAMEMLVREQSALHQRQWSHHSDVARRILLVLAAEPGARLTATDTLARFQLGAKSTVHRTLGELVDQEVLVADTDQGHRFDDPFFRRWVEVNVLEDLGRIAPPLDA